MTGDECGARETAELVSVTEAAERLGISVDTVRRRLKRGELAGAHHPTAQGFTWLIAMPVGSGASNVAPIQALDDQPAPSVDGTTVAERSRALEEEGRATAAAKDETINRLAAEVVHLRDRENTEIALLREQLHQRFRELAAEQERFDIIQQLGLQRIEVLDCDRGRARRGCSHGRTGASGSDGRGSAGGRRRG